MNLREIFIISRGTKVIFAITFTVSVLAILVAVIYYKTINDSEDPRISVAKELLAEFDQESGSGWSAGSFALLDSAGKIFSSLPDYRSSFEMGLIYNNKCSALLLMAIYDSSVSSSEKKELLSLSMDYCDTSIQRYRKWIKEWEDATIEEIEKRLSPFMSRADPAFRGSDFDRIFSGRVKSISLAQIETPRRLSVSLTNKATIYRHMMLPDSALKYYREALSLWSENRAAKSNMSVLLGGEPVKPSVIETLFPPDRRKGSNP